MGISGKHSRQSGSTFTVLLAGVAMAGALSIVIYQVMSGPMASMVRTGQKTAAKTEMTSVSRVVIMDAENQAGNGDCDNDGVIEPREWRTTAGAAPTNGGLIPNTIGAQLTDPWGAEYGYCVWDTGPLNDPATDNGCGAGVNRLQGSPDTSQGDEETQYVVAVISAGPNKVFETTCNAYVDTTTPLIVETGDDVIQRFTYGEAQAVGTELWKLKVGEPTVATVDKDLEIGAGAEVTIKTTGPDTGLINATSLSTLGLIRVGGALRLADEASVTDCAAENEGDLRYNSATDIIEVCGEQPPASGTYVWKEVEGDTGEFTEHRIPFGAVDGTLTENTSDNLTWDSVSKALKVGRKVRFIGLPGNMPEATDVTTAIATPDPVVFTNYPKVALDTIKESNAVELTGFTGAVIAYCNIGCLQIARNGVWGADVGFFFPGDTIAIRQRSATTYNTTTSASVTIGGGTSSLWRVTTINQQNVQDFTSSGTWTKPPGDWTYGTTNISCVGGGGGGQGGGWCIPGGSAWGGGGGAPGGVINVNVGTATLSATQGVTIGGGGGPGGPNGGCNGPGGSGSGGSSCMAGHCAGGGSGGGMGNGGYAWDGWAGGGGGGGSGFSNGYGNGGGGGAAWTTWGCFHWAWEPYPCGAVPGGGGAGGRCIITTTDSTTH